MDIPVRVWVDTPPVDARVVAPAISHGTICVGLLYMDATVTERLLVADRQTTSRTN